MASTSFNFEQDKTVAPVPLGPSSAGGEEAALAAVLERIVRLEDMVQRGDQRLHPHSGNENDGLLTRLGHALQGFGSGGLLMGQITMALPQLGWYRVLLDGTAGEIAACCGTPTSPLPIGVSQTTLIAPGSAVLLYRHDSRSRGIILCAVPPSATNPASYHPDYVVLGGTTGDYRKEKVYTELVARLQENRELSYFHDGSPSDQNSHDWTLLAPSGAMVHLDDQLAAVRATDLAGTWYHYADDYVRAMAYNYDFNAAAYDHHVRDDCGELVEEVGRAVYPWEAQGAYQAGETLYKTHTPQEVLFQQPVMRWEPLFDDIEPFYRRRAYYGYLGQGGKELLVARPDGRQGGARRSGDLEPDIGLWEQSVALDGECWIRTAKGFSVVKRPPLAVARREHIEEDRKHGDEKDKYRFSGLAAYGQGPAHKLDEPKYTAGKEGLHRSQAVMDRLMHTFQWKGGHPFFYHTEDFFCPEEKDLKLNRGFDQLDFTALAGGRSHLALPAADQIQLDHRASTQIYRSTSYFTMLDDGGIALGDGYGAEILLTGGDIHLTCPGDLWLMPGRHLNAWAGDDVNLRARRSVDLVASECDIRLKAEHNLHALAGNGGQGGMLLDSRGSGFAIEGAVGETLLSSGIVLRSPAGPFVAEAAQIYLRTGNDPIAAGDIVLDAARGQRDVAVSARHMDRYLVAASDWFGTTSDRGFEPQALDQFSAAGCQLHGPCYLDDDLTVAGQQQLDGALQIQSSRGVVVFGGGHFASEPGGPVSGARSDRTLQRALDEGADDAGDATDAGGDSYAAAFTNVLYADVTQIGSSAFQKQLVFTFRDDTAGQQYGLKDDYWFLLEPRWQRQSRTGEAQGGTPWKENAVARDNAAPTLPYPGTRYLKSEAHFAQLEAYLLYDPSTGTAKSRVDQQQDYESPTLKALKTVPIDNQYQTLTTT